ncbi:MAG: histone deacetylase [Deltaproteobacteria bacterium]|nr:histone deacetylase [Deltaproteobacteria bacterium]
MALKAGIVKDWRYLNHDPGSFHPETPTRLKAIYELLEAPNVADAFELIEPREATLEEIALVHSKSYIQLVAGTAGKRHISLDCDTVTSAESYDVAKLAVGGLLNAVDLVVDRDVANAFAIVRPPGHHAEEDGAAGFCIFNNVAIAALYAIKKYRFKRVLIVDWDLHHGNGTQHSFYNDPRVLYFSTHQYPFYPGSGSIHEIGMGPGLGYTINVPLGGGPGDAEFLRIYRKILDPVARAYKPDLVLLSAGFDIYMKDPMGGMNVTTRGFAQLARVLLDIADECSKGRFAVTLEGGYHIDGQAQSVKAVLREMNDDTHASPETLEAVEQDADPAIDRVIRQVTEQIEPLWKIFQ